MGSGAHRRAAPEWRTAVSLEHDFAERHANERGHISMSVDEMAAALQAELRSAYPPNPGGVHNHTPAGIGIECQEYLIGKCQLDAVQAGAAALKGYIDAHRKMHPAMALDCPMCEMEAIVGTKKMLGASAQQAVLGRDPS